MNANAPPRLSLGAMDAGDLPALSAVVQDALVRVGDIAWLRDRRRFALMMDRFCWEDARPRGPWRRVRAGLHFDGVRAVRFQGFDRDRPDALLSLMAIVRDGGEAPADDSGPEAAVTLVFSAGAAIRLDVEYIEAHVRDTGPAWDTPRRPAHDADATVAVGGPVDEGKGS